MFFLCNVLKNIVYFYLKSQCKTSLPAVFGVGKALSNRSSQTETIFALKTGSKFTDSDVSKGQLVQTNIGNMAINKSDSSKETAETCIFCLIANEQDKETKVIKKVRCTSCR